MSYHSGNIVLYPDEYMRTCASHAIALQSSRGWRIAKEKTSFKIDVIVALAMSALAVVLDCGREIVVRQYIYDPARIV
jgi:hypothetical protein